MPFRTKTLVLLPLLGPFTAPVACAQASRAALVARLDSIAGAPIREGRAVGISVAVVRETDTLLFRGYGKADRELDVNTPERAVYQIGSATKQFTAAAILQLRDERKLDLDADLTTYLPNYPTRGHRVPLRRLLDHTSGIRSYSEIRGFRSLAVREVPADSVVALFAAEPFDFAPGEAMIYNNSAYFLLGLIIEKVSGMSYEDYIEQRIFAPLGMRDSRDCRKTEVGERRALGYDYEGRTIRRAAYVSHVWTFAAGGLCSTAGDLLIWLTALHGGKVVSSRSYRDMTTPARLNDGTVLRYGMGLALGPDARGIKMVGHGGRMPGFASHVRWYPDQQLSIVVLMNSNGSVSPSALASELAGELIPGQRPVSRPFTADVAPLVGTYAGPSRGREMTVEVTRAPEGVTVSVNGAAARPLAWVDGWVFRLGGDNVVFERRGESGPATVLRFDTGQGHYVLRRK